MLRRFFLAKAATLAVLPVQTILAQNKTAQQELNLNARLFATKMGLNLYQAYFAENDPNMDFLPPEHIGRSIMTWGKDDRPKFYLQYYQDRFYELLQNQNIRKELEKAFNNSSYNYSELIKLIKLYNGGRWVENVYGHAKVLGYAEIEAKNLGFNEEQKRIFVEEFLKTKSEYANAWIGEELAIALNAGTLTIHDAIQTRRNIALSALNRTSKRIPLQLGKLEGSQLDGPV